MKPKITIATLAATTLAANAAVTIVNHEDPTDGAHTNHAGPIWGQSVTSTVDTQQVTNTTFQMRDGTGGQPADTVNAYLHAYTGTTFNTSTGAITSYGVFLGTSDNTVDIGATQTGLSPLSFDFTGVAAPASTEIFFMFNTGTTGGTGAVATGLELVTGDPFAGGTSLVANNFHNTGLGWDLRFATSFDNVAVPEPSAAILLSLGGLALILRRHK